MTVDWPSFTPWRSLAGGALIGVSAGMLVLLNGRIAGVSGVVGGLLRPARGDVGWRVSFVAGLLASPWLAAAVHRLPALRIEAGAAAIVLAGILVGVGTRYGSGCTSGHGVCGLSRQSPRSMVATLTFMAAGVIAVFVTRHVLGL